MWCKFGEFSIRSTNNPLIDLFLYSHHLSAWYCIDIVRRNSVLVTHGGLRVNMKPLSVIYFPWLFYSQQWPKENFSLQFWYNFGQKGVKKKETHQLIPDSTPHSSELKSYQMYSTQCWELIYGSREWKSLRTRYYSSHFVRFAFISSDKQGGGIMQLKCLPPKHIANDLHYGFKVHLSFRSPQPKSDNLVSNATTAHIFLLD